MPQVPVSCGYLAKLCNGTISASLADAHEELITEDYDGFVHFDYFSANCSFAWNFDIKAQYCWAHLIREIRFLLSNAVALSLSH